MKQSIEEIRDLMGNVTDRELSEPEGTLDAVAKWLQNNISDDEYATMSEDQFAQAQTRAFQTIK